MHPINATKSGLSLVVCEPNDECIVVVCALHVVLDRYRYVLIVV
jgi:hypothetical protein